MDNRLNEPCGKQPRSERVGNPRSMGQKSHDEQSAEDGKTFHAVGLSPSQALHER